jgi:hypothetical protein
MAMMRKYDYRCLDGHVFERTVDSECPPQLCFCGNKAEVVWIKFPGTLAHSNAQRFDPVTVFKKPDGTYCLPGRSNDPTPAGMQRVELNSASAVRRFEKEENSRVKRLKEESLEREDLFFSPFKKARRDLLRQQVEGSMPINRPDGKKIYHKFSGAGREFAEVAMKKSDERSSLSQKACKFNPNFHVQAFSMDSGNRLPFNDIDTGLKDRK